jgi:predicted NACHT family NTPase
MQKADYLLQLMKQRTDALVATDEKLQQFLMWVNEKSISVEVPYKPAVVRAFYLYQTLDRALDRALNLDLPLNLPLNVTLALNRALDLDLPLALDCALDRALELEDAPDRDHDLPLDRAFAPKLKKALKQLKNQLSDADREAERLKEWWQANGQAWTEQVRAVMIKHRNIGHDWQFSVQQKEVLREYYDANLLLVECLNSDCDVTPAVLQEIGETLLLPIAEIQKHR